MDFDEFLDGVEAEEASLAVHDLPTDVLIFELRRRGFIEVEPCADGGFHIMGKLDRAHRLDSDCRPLEGQG